MKNNLYILCIGLAFAACQKSDTEALNELRKVALNDILSDDQIFTAGEESYQETQLGYSSENTTGGAFLCNGKRIDETLVLDNLTVNAFDDRAATNTAGLYPGSIIKLKDFKEINDINPIGAFARAPLQVSSTLGDIRLVEDPSQRGNVDKAIKEIENAQDGFAAQVISESESAYSFEQAMIHVGIDYKYLGNSVKSKFDIESTVEQQSFVVKFYQIYHTVSINNPVDPADLFDPSTDPSQLENLITNSGPLGFISEVAYGRMLVGIFTYKGTDFKTSSEVEGKFRKGLASVDGEIDVKTRNFFKSSTFKVAILGGDAEEASKVAGSGLGMESIQAAYQFMKAGGSDPSLGVPIQYKIRQLADPNYSTFAIDGVVSYEIPDCDKLPESLKIKKVTLTSSPPHKVEDGENKLWDAVVLTEAWKHADVFPRFFRYDSDWVELANYEEIRVDDITADKLPVDYEMSYNIDKKDWNKSFGFQWVDRDNNVAVITYETMGWLGFNFRKHIQSISNPNPSDPFPTKISVSEGSFRADVHLEWN